MLKYLAYIARKITVVRLLHEAMARIEALEVEVAALKN
jgi:hypothetical protein